MDARAVRAACAALAVAAFFSLGAGSRSENFIVTASTADFAERVANAAEVQRRDLALHWLGRELPRWSQPCPIEVQDGPTLGAGGETSFTFDHGEVFGWRMRIQGTQERILDSVLPHEITHTVFATHFREPLPRWADEGACTTVEDESEQAKHRRMVVEFLQTNRGIAFSRMFAMKDYPRDILPLYAQGHSLATFLLDQGGPRKFVEFVGAGLASKRWAEEVETHYGFASLQILQDDWLAWVKDGGRASLVRGQSPERGPSTNIRSENEADRESLASATLAANESLSEDAYVSAAESTDDDWTKLVPVRRPRSARPANEPIARSPRNRRVPGPNDWRAVDAMAKASDWRPSTERLAELPKDVRGRRLDSPSGGKRKSIYAMR